ncbi:RNA polymerase alpha subunit C-terminal domain-containing protein [Flavihumibacter sp. RY-1]|uniref:RNA polymerase alpha subunit C-terminal domain-containing protein n=1 Tax=Flavihumibacter fluminis TaxID=2909236 RepID=A0ABS9BIW0_9BACT|nr:RNA polymerase alpha subunit C-terminal domain-containing protein [Flavihumibacter fluminis]MCF1715053.1 RNA polymerase alpha subunit C-terminal domain-containing protein [Flavihumibacter fluminis]
MAIASLKTCSIGHSFYKTSDCPTCPICEAARKPLEGFQSILSAPARRALEQAGIHSVKDLSLHSEKEILQLHGIGPSSLPKLKEALKKEGLTFKSTP